MLDVMKIMVTSFKRSFARTATLSAPNPAAGAANHCRPTPPPETLGHLLDEAQAGIKIAGRNINNLRYADETTFMAQSEELKRLLMKVKE